MATAPTAVSAQAPQRIAPLWHTAGFLVLMTVPIITGIYHKPERYSAHEIAFWRFCIPALIYDWGLVAYACWGLRRGKSMTVRELIGGSWGRVRYVFRDLGLGFGFLVLGITCMGITIRLLGGAQPKAISMLLPRSAVETTVWVLLAMTAGFAEELVYRGYLQTQLAGLGLPMPLAIVAQALLFGAGHTWEGPKLVVAIAVFAVFAGVVALWRRSLRPNMIGHALMDISVLLARYA